MSSNNYLKMTAISAFLSCAAAIGMQQPAMLEDYEQDRDKEAIYTIFKSNWENLFVGRPYSQEIVDTLFKPQLYPEADEMRKVIRRDNKTIAFITYYFFRNRTENKGYIESLAVDQDSRRHGYATQLLHQALNDLKKKGADKISIYAKKDNKPALTLYQKLGFRNTDKSAIRDTSWQLCYTFDEKK